MRARLFSGECSAAEMGSRSGEGANTAAAPAALQPIMAGVSEATVVFFGLKMSAPYESWLLTLLPLDGRVESSRVESYRTQWESYYVKDQILIFSSLV